MRWIVDTNIISELRRADCHPAVRAWSATAPSRGLFLSMVTIAEIRHGIELAAPRLREALRDWLDTHVRRFFAGRILEIDEDTLLAWRGIAARLQRKGRPVSPPDALIAASAHRHGCGIVTRNIGDFRRTGVRLFDPATGRHYPVEAMP